MAHETRLLIADDDAAFRETVVEIVEPYFATIAVESGEQAIEVIGQSSIDLVLFDMHMHLLSGLDALRWMRDHRMGVPCILMSAHVTAELEEQASQLLVSAVLRKPPRRDHLLDTIHGALEL